MSRQVVSGTMLLMLLFSMFMCACGKVSAADYPAIYVEPASIIEPTLTPGENFTISIKTNYTGCDITAYQFELSYNASILHGVKVTNGDLITTDKHFSAQFRPGTFNNTAGKLSLTGAFFFYIFPPPATTSGPGTLANVTFTVVGTGKSAMTIELSPYSRGGLLFGWDFVGEEVYHIINAFTMPYHLGHGYFSNARELKTEIEELGSQGEIDNQGIVKSLIAKLNVAQKLIDNDKIDQARNLLHAFINEVQAQSGKHITPEAAELLIKSAEHILTNL